jgi:hypothetical protein
VAVYKLVMGIIVAVVLGLATATVVNVPPAKKEPTNLYSLEFSLVERTRPSMTPTAGNNRYRCRRGSDMLECLRAAGKDVCGAGERFLVEKAPSSAAGKVAEFNYACVVVEKRQPPAL